MNRRTRRTPGTFPAARPDRHNSDDTRLDPGRPTNSAHLTVTATTALPAAGLAAFTGYGALYWLGKTGRAKFGGGVDRGTRVRSSGA